MHICIHGSLAGKHVALYSLFFQNVPRLTASHLGSLHTARFLSGSSSRQPCSSLCCLSSLFPPLYFSGPSLTLPSLHLPLLVIDSFEPACAYHSFLLVFCLANRCYFFLNNLCCRFPIVLWCKSAVKPGCRSLTSSSRKMSPVTRMRKGEQLKKQSIEKIKQC